MRTEWDAPIRTKESKDCNGLRRILEHWQLPTTPLLRSVAGGDASRRACPERSEGTLQSARRRFFLDHSLGLLGQLLDARAGPRSDPLDPHMREARFAKAKHARGGGRDIYDPAANEWPPIDDLKEAATDYPSS
jgi:hypothetical protein